MKAIIKILLFTIIISFCIPHVSYAQDEDGTYESLYRFESFLEDGEVLYDKKSPITLDGEHIKFKKIYDTNKNMFRGTWIATISNINFPSEKGMTLSALKEEFNSILDRVEEINLNAIFFQVSPELDAFYESKYRPWSKYLTGEQGVAPSYLDSGEDFLTYAISESRKRGIEFHAWFNPYRVTKEPHLDKTKDEILSMLSPNNFASLNKDLVYLFQGKLFLDPGRVEVMNFIKDTVHEFICKYDVDGVHFDDYFYPYGSQTIKGVSYKFGDMGEDKHTFEINNRGIENIEDWRRDNVNVLIRSVRDIITHYNHTNSKSVQWGISPFGIYAHKEDGLKDLSGNDLKSSNTPKSSLSSYRDIYADSLYWIDNDLIDYIIPQIYWPFGKSEAPYEELINFWSDAVKDKRCQLYIGHGNYCIREVKGDKAWNNPYEIINQMKFNMNYDNILGSVFFSVNDIAKEIDSSNKRERVYRKYIDLLEDDILKDKSIIPGKPWLDHKPTSEVYDLRALKGNDHKYYLFFKDKIDNDSKFYVVYGFEEEDSIDKEDAKYILGIYGKEYNKEFQSILLEDIHDNIKTFIVSVQDEAGVESEGVRYSF